VNAELGKKDFSEADIEQLRQRVLTHKGSRSWTALGDEMGIPAGTLSPWATGSYPGDAAAVAARIYRFFVAYEEQQELSRSLPAAPNFQQTETARRILTVLTMGQLGDMVAISTPPGIGKTAALTQYQATRPKVWRSTMAPSSRGVPTMLLALLAAMGDRDAKGTPQVLSGKIRSRVGPGSLLILDEAQHLSHQALEELRSIHDETGCGIALVGDEHLLANLRKYSQLYSRLGMKHVQKAPTRGDVVTIAEAWKVTDPAAVAFLQEIAKKPGAIRAVTKTLMLASHANQVGGPLAVDEIREAYGQLYEHVA